MKFAQMVAAGVVSDQFVCVRCVQTKGVVVHAP